MICKTFIKPDSTFDSFAWWMLLANTIALLYMSFLVMSMHDHDLINVDGGADQPCKRAKNSGQGAKWIGHMGKGTCRKTRVKLTCRPTQQVNMLKSKAASKTLQFSGPFSKVLLPTKSGCWPQAQKSAYLNHNDSADWQPRSKDFVLIGKGMVLRHAL